MWCPKSISVAHYPGLLLGHCRHMLWIEPTPVSVGQGRALFGSDMLQWYVTIRGSIISFVTSSRLKAMLLDKNKALQLGKKWYSKKILTLKCTKWYIKLYQLSNHQSPRNWGKIILNWQPKFPTIIYHFLINFWDHWFLAQGDGLLATVV